jgi:hypothetical protein
MKNNMGLLDLLWWFFDLDKHSSQINNLAAQTPPVQQQPELDAYDPDYEDMDIFNDDFDDEFFE